MNYSGIVFQLQAEGEKNSIQAISVVFACPCRPPSLESHSLNWATMVSTRQRGGHHERSQKEDPLMVRSRVQAAEPHSVRPAGCFVGTHCPVPRHQRCLVHKWRCPAGAVLPWGRLPHSSSSVAGLSCCTQPGPAANSSNW